MHLDNAGGNKSVHSNVDVNMRKLDEDTETFKRMYIHFHISLFILCPVDEKVDASLCKAISQARLAKKMTQKALATVTILFLNSLFHEFFNV